MRIYTIGFTGKTAEEFFGLLNSTDARHLVDIRINNRSQLAGFTKKGNIEFFVDKLTRMSYLEMPMLAPGKTCSESIEKMATGTYTNLAT